MISLITVFAHPAPNNAQLPCVVREIKRAGMTRIDAVTWCGNQHEAANGLLQMPSNIPCCPRCTNQIEVFSQQLAGLAVAVRG